MTDDGRQIKDDLIFILTLCGIGKEQRHAIPQAKF